MLRQLLCRGGIYPGVYVSKHIYSPGPLMLYSNSGRLVSAVGRVDGWRIVETPEDIQGSCELNKQSRTNYQPAMSVGYRRAPTDRGPGNRLQPVAVESRLELPSCHLPPPQPVKYVALSRGTLSVTL